MAHSHHFWPDVTLDAMIEYWQDSAQLSASKWDYILEEKTEQTQSLVAEILHLSDHRRLVFGSSGVDFVYKIISSIEDKKPVRILTTDSESASIEHQFKRLQDAGLVTFRKMPTQPFNTFRSRFHAELKQGGYDLVYLSHIFSNSGVVAPIETVASTCADMGVECIIDASLSFFFRPIDWKPLEKTCFLVVNGEGYAQAGEGCSFLYVPVTATRLRPLPTAWMADRLDKVKSEYLLRQSRDGWQFASSALDFSGLYRLNAVLRRFKKLTLTVENIHDYILHLQKMFLFEIENLRNPLVRIESLLMHDIDNHGPIFTFELVQPETAQILCHELKSAGIITDTFGSRLRFGFGLYLNGPFDLSVINQKMAKFSKK